MVEKIIFIVILAGCLSRYDPGVMDRSINNNIRYGNIETTRIPECAIAVRSCADVGEIFWIRNGDGEWTKCLAADCASKSDRQSETDPRSGYEWMITSNIIAELDYDTAMDIGMGCDAELAVQEHVRIYEME